MDPPTTTLYIATSVDGFVAAADGGVAWLDEFHSEPTTDAYEAFFAEIDALVMGARTYEQVRSFGDWPYGDRPTYVLTHSEETPALDTVEFVSGDVADLSSRLRDRHDHIWLVGGAEVARAFLRAGLVDELRLTIVPLLLGDGVRLFGTDGPHTRLELLDSTTYETGLVELRYAVG